jgi:hypothetical protein
MIDVVRIYTICERANYNEYSKYPKMVEVDVLQAHLIIAFITKA